MKKIAIIFGGSLLLVPLASGSSMSNTKEIYTEPTTELRPQLSRENLESGIRVDPGGPKHCPISDVNLLKCESGPDFLPYQHPADADGPWWFGRYKGD
jgi:hypothetical protein